MSATAEDMAIRTESANCSSRCGPAEAEPHVRHSSAKNIFNWSGTVEMERVKANHAALGHHLGPWATQVSSNSLNRALASSTGHVGKVMRVSICLFT